MILPRLEASEGLAKGQVANDIEGRVVVPSYSVKWSLTTFASLVQLLDEKIHVIDNYRLLVSHYTHPLEYFARGESRGGKGRKNVVGEGTEIKSPSVDEIGGTSTYYSDR